MGLICMRVIAINLIVGLVFSVCAFSSVVMAAEWSAQLNLKSRYLFRGLLQSKDSAALQGVADLSWQNGAYVGGWSSVVMGGDQGEVELNYYGGKLFKLNNVIWNLGSIYYDYRHVPTNVSRKEVY